MMMQQIDPDISAEVAKNMKIAETAEKSQEEVRQSKGVELETPKPGFRTYPY